MPGSRIEQLSQELDKMGGSETPSKDDSFDSQIVEQATRMHAPEAIPETDFNNIFEKYATQADRAAGVATRLETERPAPKFNYEHWKHEHDSATTENRLKIDWELIQKAFEEAAPDNVTERPVYKDDSGKEIPWGYSELKLKGMQCLDKRGTPPTEMDIDDIIHDTNFWEQGRKEHKPKIFYTPVYEEVKDGWLFSKKTKMVMTNQVVVTCVMFDGNEGKNNSVITMLVEHEGGHLKWADSTTNALYELQSETEYKEKVISGKSGRNVEGATPDQRLARGEITTNEYEELYYKNNYKHKTLDQEQKERDAKINKDPGSHNPRREDILDERKQKQEQLDNMLESMRTEYTEQLQEVQRIQNEIVTEAAKELQTLVERNEKIIASPSFGALLECVRQLEKEGTEGKYLAAMAALIENLANTFHVSAKEVKDLLELKK